MEITQIIPPSSDKNTFEFGGQGKERYFLQGDVKRKIGHV
jgi:hypothetical protein